MTLTSKQLGDAGELLVAAQLTLHGIPAYIVPTNWPGYDVAADLKEGVQRISVKTRTGGEGSRSVAWNSVDQFDWLAIVILSGSEPPPRLFVKPKIFLVPQAIAEERAVKRPERNERGWQLSQLISRVGEFENNFTLQASPDLLHSS